MLVRVAFRYNDRRMFARLVCWLRGGDSAHCEVASVLTDTGLHHCVSSSWLDGGVRGKWMPLPADRWRVYEIEAATTADADADLVAVASFTDGHGAAVWLAAM